MVVGVDAGGTRTRCVVAAPDGTVAGRGRAGGANPHSSGGALVETLAAALGAALSTLDGRDVRLGVFGGAGSAGAGATGFRAAAADAWERVGLTGKVHTVTDLEVAFAAGTAEPDGALLLAGTGAVAVRFAGGAVARRCDGYGWLLGDEGSGVWLGVRALRAVLAALDGRGEPTALVAPACVLLGIPPQSWAGLPARSWAGPDEREALAQAVLAAAFAQPPAALGRLAPHVSAAADDGDPVAVRLCAEARDRLLHSLDTVGPRVGRPVVLGGSVLLRDGPIAREIRAAVAERYEVRPRTASDGAGGAAALALARLTGTTVDPTVHRRLTSGHEPGRE
ncbi:N-acetylglucosamine kinase [Virgisporangium aliadipatigenens]|uniref:N-acetylglucosamine kinase n=2 Tax=Virgisporangium aliadipatigenens TaxID=741659 RepID=A0A8J3YGC0_9ACTN|nr:N-acetylglucosamine kinase [Virgisporangium aliadipatigenens]